MKNTTQVGIKDLLSASDPQAWKDWIFHIQQNLIYYGYVETLTEEGRANHTALFTSLYEFFGTFQPKMK